MYSNMKRSESTEQMALIDWCNVNRCVYPELDLIYKISNEGKRSVHQGKKFKREGLKKGVPDLCLPVPSGIYHGLYIELKYGNGITSKEQKEWIKKLNDQGYKAVVCNGFEEARDTIKEYLDNKKVI
ncbi:VRR-NUC domain-containing protein [Romboutsia sp. 1001713B170131_170501_G6]|uniref:VRR-NUC domain-containing protein n=1 Tax=Romboutsia sp. 1001713B170131_170501_G6 TaxID=2787108 RepID=UPI0018AC7311|nr:VRR-NUC domain-containing protein [Romboutsia sp. 1001713B170131_170501_G6]